MWYALNVYSKLYDTMVWSVVAYGEEKTDVASYVKISILVMNIITYLDVVPYTRVVRNISKNTTIYTQIWQNFVSYCHQIEYLS